MPSERERLGDEAFVRSRWKLVQEGIYDPHEGYTIPQTRVVLRSGLWFTKEKRTDAYKAAADYTEQREKQIAEKREEIDLMRDVIKDRGRKEGGRAARRILATLEAQLDELRKGMKG